MAVSQRLMEHLDDPKQEILSRLGSLDGFTLYGNRILLAIYVRPEKTKSGIFLPEQHRKEDVYQGKAGLVVFLGDAAWKATEPEWIERFDKANKGVHHWVWFNPSDTRSVTINGVECRSIRDQDIGGELPHPDFVW